MATSKTTAAAEQQAAMRDTIIGDGVLRALTIAELLETELARKTTECSGLHLELALRVRVLLEAVQACVGHELADIGEAYRKVYCEDMPAAEAAA